VHALRGGIVESAHRGAIAIVDADGAVHTQRGDIDRPIFPRSAVKVLQALGAYADVEKSAASRQVRSGVGKMRNRRHVQRRLGRLPPVQRVRRRLRGVGRDGQAARGAGRERQRQQPARERSAVQARRHCDCCSRGSERPAARSRLLLS
jgi:hypothetical protein